MTSNIVDVARASGTLTTLLEAISRARLEETLAGEGPFTVFAPHDDAFAELPERAVESLLGQSDTLTSVVTYHLVPGRLAAAEVTCCIDRVLLPAQI